MFLLENTKHALEHGGERRKKKTKKKTTSTKLPFSPLSLLKKGKVIPKRLGYWLVIKEL
jgi:hypothetical protein